MTNLIKRNDTLEKVLKYWNHNNPSNIGIGRLSRKINADGIYVISKTYGREDLALFNIEKKITINGELLDNRMLYSTQLSFEPNGVNYHNYDFPLIKTYIANWVETNKDELHIQLHYLNWFNTVEIKDLTLEETIKVLESYKYDETEAKLLFENLVY